MSDTIKIDVEGSDEAAKKLKDVAGAVGDVNEELDKNKDANDGASKSTSSFAEKAVKAGIALAGLKAILVDTLKAYAEQDAINGQLQRSLKKVSDSTETAAKTFKKAQATFANNAQFGIGIAAQTAAYRKLIDSSGDAEQALEDLTLAVDIQAQSDMDLAGATDALKKARQGDVGALKDLGVLTKDQEARLSALTNETDRAEIAVQLLSEAYSGAARENKGLADNLAETDVQFERVKVATGKLVGALWTGANSLTDATLEVAGVLPQGTSTLDAFATGMGRFAEATTEATSELSKFLTEYTLTDFIVGNDIGDVLGRVEGRKAKTEAKDVFQIDDVLGPSAEDMQRYAERRQKIAMEMVAADKASAAAKVKAAAAAEREAAAAERIADAKASEGFEGGFGDAEAEIIEEKKIEAAQKKLDFELQLQTIQNARTITNNERLLLELEYEKELLTIKNASLDPELERLKIADAGFKLAKKVKGLDEAKRVKTETTNLKKKADAEATVGEAITLSSQGFSTAADLFGAGERTKAGISGAMEAAKSIASAASYDIPGAIGHGLAAASFFAVAAGGGGGGGGTGATSVAAEGASFGGSDSEELALAGRSETGRQASALTITNNYNSVFPPSPEQEREARAATERAARRSI